MQNILSFFWRLSYKKGHKRKGREKGKKRYRAKTSSHHNNVQSKWFMQKRDDRYHWKNQRVFIQCYSRHFMLNLDTLHKLTFLCLLSFLSYVFFVCTFVCLFACWCMYACGVLFYPGQFFLSLLLIWCDHYRLSYCECIQNPLVILLFHSYIHSRPLDPFDVFICSFSGVSAIFTSTFNILKYGMHILQIFFKRKMIR